jgi:hypothetical protein
MKQGERDIANTEAFHYSYFFDNRYEFFRCHPIGNYVAIPKVAVGISVSVNPLARIRATSSSLGCMVK